MEFMSAREAADKWGISQRRVAVLCSEGRIKNAEMLGNMWLIPLMAQKPADARSIRYIKNDDKKDVEPKEINKEQVNVDVKENNINAKQENKNITTNSQVKQEPVIHNNRKRRNKKRKGRR